MLGADGQVSRVAAYTRYTSHASAPPVEEPHAERGLHGILPICRHRYQIRDGEGYWHRVDTYIRQHTEANFSHGICPECLASFYPECADRG